jgi:hypothetical protein
MSLVSQSKYIKQKQPDIVFSEVRRGEGGDMGKREK